MWPVLEHRMTVSVAGQSPPVSCCLAIGWNGGSRVSLLLSPLCSNLDTCATKKLFEQHRAPERFRDQVTREQLQGLLQQLIEREPGLVTGLNAGEMVTYGFPVHLTPVIENIGTNPTLADYRILCRATNELLRIRLIDALDDGKLYPYQQAGVEWLLSSPTRILADDMGLGKTVQVIRAMLHLFQAGEVSDALVVAPVSLLQNWREELVKWAPDLTIAMMTPSAAVTQESWELVHGRVHVLLTNYEQLRQPPRAITLTRLGLVIADEAHRIRKGGTRLTKGLRTLQPHRFWALTGTPIERDPADLINLLITMAPGRFTLRDAKAPPPLVRSMAKTYLLRRLKTDVLSELPEVNETTEWLDLAPQQREEYDRAYREFCLCSEPERLLSIFGTLRSLCDYEAITGASSKLDRVAELIGQIRSSSEKVIVFSYILAPLDLLGKKLLRRYRDRVALKVDGRLAKSERDRLIERFKTDKSVTALLLSTRVGGEGLNLTEANHVVYINQWWNPSLNRQARDRVVRIGQQRPVTTYRLLCRNTIEESLERLLDSKESIVEEIIERLAQRPQASDETTTLLLKLVEGES